MSTPNMQFEPETLKLINEALQRLKEKVKHNACPRCDVFDWGVDPVAINMIPLAGVPAGIPNAYFPSRSLVLQIVCKNCGNTIFHNLRILGLAQ